jgi:hypothetical protein
MTLAPMGVFFLFINKKKIVCATLGSSVMDLCFDCSRFNALLCLFPYFSVLCWSRRDLACLSGAGKGEKASPRHSSNGKFSFLEVSSVFVQGNAVV